MMHIFSTVIILFIYVFFYLFRLYYFLGEKVFLPNRASEKAGGYLDKLL